MPTSRRERGDAGEAFVAGRLERAGYRVVERNWHCRWGEIDLVALHGNVLVFVEVRVRTGERFGQADETVGPAKLNRILATGEAYVQAHEEYRDLMWRVDLVAITLDGRGAVTAYRHYENLTLD